MLLPLLLNLGMTGLQNTVGGLHFEGGKKQKRRKKPLSWSEYADAEERTAAMKVMLAQNNIVPRPMPIEYEDEDDELLTAVLLKVLH